MGLKGKIFGKVLNVPLNKLLEMNHRMVTGTINLLQPKKLLIRVCFLQTLCLKRPAALHDV